MEDSSRNKNKRLILLTVFNILLILLISFQMCCVVSSSRLRGMDNIDRAQVLESSSAETRLSYADLDGSGNIIKKICVSKMLQSFEEPREQIKASSSEMKLPIALTGVFVTPYRRVAFIEDLTNFASLTCGVGDVVAGVRITAISLEKVDVEFMGKPGSLFVKNTVRGTGADEKIFGYEDIIYKTDEEIVVDRNALANAIKGDVTSLLTELKIRPLLTRGRIEGFVINEIKKGGLVDNARFEDGDIIKAVNGQQLDSFQKALQVFKKIKTQPVITVDVLRNDEVEKLVYRVK